MANFVERHSDSILGINSCFDRLILTGMLPDIGYPKAMTAFFLRKRIMLKGFAEWAKPMRDEIRNNAETLAEQNGVEIEFVRKTNSFRKDDRVKKIIAERGDHPGLVHIFSAMESCTAFKPWHDKNTHKNYFKYDTGRCLHYYFYFIDREFGLCYLRVPTWAPFRLQFYCNGHNWLARQLDKKGVSYQMLENVFVQIDDCEKAQNIADEFPVKRLHKMLVRYARTFCPPVDNFKSGIHWSVMQAEYATDIIFKSKGVLAPVYEELVRTLCHAVKPETVSMFLGKKLDPRFAGELAGQFSTRIEGHSIRHYMGRNGIKMYDKLGCALRVETFSNDITFFKHHRRVEHRDGTYSYKTAAMRKTIYSLPDLAKLMSGCNRRYIEFLSGVDDPTNGIRKVKKISERVRESGRSYRGFNIFNAKDESVFRAIAQGDYQGFGIRNANIRKALGKSVSQVSLIIKRLRNHGILKKVSNSYKYYLTTLGKEIVAASLKLKEMFLIPLLRGQMKPV